MELSRDLIELLQQKNSNIEVKMLKNLLSMLGHWRFDFFSIIG